MTTSIIGTGTVGMTLARLFARAGLSARIANTRGAASISLDDDLRAACTPVDLPDALEADLVIAAVPFGSMPALGASLGSWSGRVVVDVTNAYGVEPEAFNGRSSAEHNADFFTGAKFVRGLNHLPYNVFAADTPGPDGQRAVFLSGDDADANTRVASLAEDLGFASIDLGSLSVGGPLLGLDGPLLMKNLILYPA